MLESSNKTNKTLCTKICFELNTVLCVVFNYSANSLGVEPLLLSKNEESSIIMVFSCGDQVGRQVGTLKAIIVELMWPQRPLI